MCLNFKYNEQNTQTSIWLGEWMIRVLANFTMVKGIFGSFIWASYCAGVP